MKITVVTNLPAPYRIPIWNHLGLRNELTVYFLLGEVNWRGWELENNQNWSFKFLNFWNIKWGEVEIIPSIRGAWRTVKEAEVLVLSGWHTPFYVVVSCFARIMKKTLIQFYESSPGNSTFNNFLAKFIKAKVLNLSDAIVTINQTCSKYLTSIGVHPEKITVLFNPIANKDWILKVNKYDNLRKRKSILFVGQLIPRKAVDDLINAYGELFTKDFELDIVGNGIESKSLKQLASKSVVSEKIHFYGHLTGEQLAERFALNTILVLPSYSEVWGLVVNEALACGMHVVVNRSCGVVDLVQSMKGVTVYSGGKDSLRNAMNRALSNYDKKIEEPEISKFDCVNFSRSLEKIIDDLINYKDSNEFI